MEGEEEEKSSENRLSQLISTKNDRCKNLHCISADKMVMLPNTIVATLLL